MDISAILFNRMWPSEQSVNSPLTDSIWSVAKIGPAVSEEKLFKDSMIIYMYIAQYAIKMGPVTSGIVYKDGGQN